MSSRWYAKAHEFLNRSQITLYHTFSLMAFKRRHITSVPEYSRSYERWKSSSSKLPLILFIFVTILISLFFWVRSVGSTDVPAGIYSLDKWVTLSQIPKSLRLDIGATRYKLWLRFFAPSVSKIQAGSYKVSELMPLSKVLTETLTKPIYTDITITILPGWNMYDIDAYLSDKGILPTWAFLLGARDSFSTLQSKYPFLRDRISIDGFLYPDTYRITPTADASMILGRLLSEWQKKIYPTYQTLGDTAYPELILASIVEREERDSREKPIVAEILAKRVREGIAMWADATVCYGYAKTQKQCTPAFIGSVIGEKSSYNTRSQRWYPPTPIASMSLDTWDAVLEKKSSPYYYYLHGSDGTIYYGKTLAEHNQNKSTYLK